MADFSERLAVCVQTRKLAAAALAEALQEALSSGEPISEVALRDRWLHHLRKNKTIYPDGWYMPPPHGIILLFATDTNPGRLMSDSYRKAEAWSSDDVFLDRKNGLIMAYSSPVDRATGIIGDFGVTLYFGQKQEVKDHLANCLQLDHDIAKNLTIGMKIWEVTTLANKLMEERAMTNFVVSINDPAGVNIGHSIPATIKGWNNKERSVFEANDWQATKDMISGKRFFVSSAETTKLQEGMAITIEPRPRLPEQPHLPMVAYHTIVTFDRGSKQFLTGFDDLFAIAGMDYMPGYNRTTI